MGTGCSRDVVHIDPKISEALFQLVRNNLSSQLNTRLHRLSHADRYLRILNRYDKEEVSLLMVAAIYGYDETIRVLLNYDNTIHHVELKGQIILSDGTSIAGVTALYCACYNGHFTVAKTLIELGHASVNQNTNDYPFCPLLLEATINNRQDIVGFLLENKYADINQTKSLDHRDLTALMVAIGCDNRSLVEYLIDMGADVNCTCQDVDLIFSRPIGLAVLKGHIDIVRLLYHAGADAKIKNEHAEVLVTVAVRREFPAIIDFLLDESINTIEDLELAGCSLVKIDSSIQDMAYMLSILKMALKRREQSNMSKTCIEPIDAYDYQQECQTVDELDLIKDDRNRMYLETLLIRNRIALSRNDISIVKPLHHYGDVLVERRQFEKCLNVWIHMFYLYQNMNIATILHRFIWLFCRMLRTNNKIAVYWFLEVGQLVFEPSQLYSKETTIVNAFFLVIIATKILEREEMSGSDRTAIYRWVNDLCRYQLTDDDGRNLLHYCAGHRPRFAHYFRSTDSALDIEFSNESALRLLLASGSRWLDLDAVESSAGNTPLHVICMQSNNRQILELFLKVGCHTDCFNKYGHTPLDFVEDSEMKSLFPSKKIPSKLKCLCARLIAKKRLNINGSTVLTPTLNKFIVLHGYHLKKRKDKV